MSRKLSRGARNIKWIETYCSVPEGSLVGQPVKLRRWQRREIKKIYDNPAGTRRAILSFGRKNGKTALCAWILLLHLAGPEMLENSTIYSAAQSRDQAAIVFSLAAKTVRLNATLDAVIKIIDSKKQLKCEEIGTLYRALSADAATNFGISPVLIIHDELGQVRGPKSNLYEALETSTAGQSAPLSIIISTQAPNPNDLLSVLIDDAQTCADPRTVLALYSAPEELDPFSKKAIKAANPAFGDFQNAEEVLSQAADAQRMPSREAEFRNLILNQRVEMHAPFLARSVWELGKASPPDFGDAEVYGGLDLSAVSDLTSVVYIAKINGVWAVKPRFWLPADGLEEKSRQDRVSYDLWARAGYLETTPGKSIGYEYVAALLFEDAQRMNLKRIAFDRYNFKFLSPALINAGFRAEELDQKNPNALFVEFGQGFLSMSPALRELETQALAGALLHGDHPVLKMCIANSVVTTNPAGDRKLDKSKRTGRIDGAVALAMAFGITPQQPAQLKSYIEDRGVLFT